MRAIRRGSYPILLLLILWCGALTTKASEVSTIKVGLESIYKNATSIVIGSDTNIEIGYYDDYGFVPVGILEASNITLSKESSQYYDLGGFYPTYQEAERVANEVLGVPVYIDQDLFAVYTTNPVGNIVEASANRYVVQDQTGQAIFIFNQVTNPIVFRGYDQASGLSLTKVGDSKKYRGAIGIGGTTGITPYNILSIEEYLYGVVPCEMSASWPQEALKAQAVAARSIAIYQYKRFLSSGYNVVDTTTTQVYGGYNREDNRTTLAVDATKGQTIQYNGAVAEALYFSTSGGYTESAVNVWGNPIGYLIGVEDIYETEPAQPAWTRTITLSEIDKCLASKGVSIGTAQGVQIVSKTPSGRVQEMCILGTIGSYNLTLENIRTFFSSTSGGSLKSRLFTLVGSGSTDIGGITGASNVVTVVSATGVADVALDEAIVTNGEVTQPILGESATIQSATTVEQVALNNQTPPTGTPSGEVVYGDVTIQGKGFGHGVGMSQSGAKGMAKAGFSYIEILQHYYTGVTVG